ncbi:hypothetical protein EUBVEN_02338 [Eubacterium ventriosum ATCC 27560]|uniref:Uncharacterized protein n=1 Tax=Eubacterium ventriosum ATCC 27560 TaxID=411463 RepID=A5Z9E3_9FIRM|nr:hypothetical protein EUBVEN_02338 [Eubacterium ventriosum ATCC 27560]
MPTATDNTMKLSPICSFALRAKIAVPFRASASATARQPTNIP